MTRSLFTRGLLLLVFWLAGCQAAPPPATPTTLPSTPTPGNPPPTSPPATAVAATRYTYEILNRYPHDPAAFTQGLIYLDGVLYEGTGLNGRSSIRRVELESGQVLQQRDLPAEYFGEGIVAWGDRLYQLTWQSQIGFIYDLESFELLGEFRYPGEGWGLTHNGKQLIMSDGSAVLRFWDPETLAENGRLPVYDENGPVVRLNELEYVNGEIWANVWQTDRIARIDPQTGRVTGWIDLSGLLDPAGLNQPVDVLNGIAYDAAQDRLFVTGKLWPELFEIRLTIDD
jgi:glutaminyl-peptide cyclotransferase